MGMDDELAPSKTTLWRTALHHPRRINSARGWKGKNGTPEQQEMLSKLHPRLGGLCFVGDGRF